MGCRDSVRACYVFYVKVARYGIVIVAGWSGGGSLGVNFKLKPKG